MPEQYVTSTKAWRIFTGLQGTLAQIQASKPTADVRPLVKVFDLIVSQVDLLDADLVTSANIAGLQPHFANAAGELNAFNGDNNATHLEQARGHLVNAMTVLATLPKVTTAEEVQAAYGRVLEHTRTTADSVIEGLRVQVNALQGAADKVAEQFVRMSESVESVKGRTDSVVTEFQKQFSANENERSRLFQEALNEGGRKIAQQSTELDEGVQGFIKLVEDNGKATTDKLGKEADALLQLLRKRDEETKALAVAMGATGISSNYQSTANKNERAANWLRGFTIALLAVLVVVVLHTLWSVTTLDIQQVLSRLLAALLVGLPAAYLAHESSRQRAEATRARRIELELTALTPFIENLPADKKEAVRNKLVDTYFGRAFDKVEKADDAVPIGGTVVDLVKALSSLVKK